LTEKQAIYYELLVLQCRRDQKDALEELVGSWERRLFYYIRRLVEDEQDAWQVLQETWVRVLQGIRKLREPRKLPAWPDITGSQRGLNAVLRGNPTGRARSTFPLCELRSTPFGRGPIHPRASPWNSALRVIRGPIG